MSGTQIHVDTARFGPASERLREVGDGIVQLEMSLAGRTWYPAEAWRTAAAIKLVHAAGEASLVGVGAAGLAGMAHGLADHLLQAQQWYEQVDAEVVAAFAELSDAATTALVYGIVDLGLIGAGALAATLATPGGIALVLAGVVTYHGLEEAGLGVDGADLAEWFETNQHTLANPVMVMLVRTLASGGDELLVAAASGAAGAAGGVLLGPFGAALAKAMIRQGISSPQSAAGVIADVVQRVRGQYRYEIERSERPPTAAPQSIAALMQSIPETTPEGTHVRISEYRAPDGETVFVVSVAGTSSTGFGGENPMDNLSNLAAYAGQDDETIGATIAAMEQAGIASGDAVVFAGYSQGALVAAALAGSQQWATQSVLLAGSPIHGNAIGGEVPVVQLEHSGDLITGLQGFAPPAAGDVAVVHRDPYPDGVPAEDGILGPHLMQNYRETAALYDEHSEASAVANREAVLSPLADAAPVATHDFHLQREYPESASADAANPDAASPGAASPGAQNPGSGSVFGEFLSPPAGPVGILGVEEALAPDSLGPDSLEPDSVDGLMPDAFQVELPGPGR